MNNIRQAIHADLTRISEIEIFNYRLNFYPIFRSDWFYFSYLTVPTLIEKYKAEISKFYVYDDGSVKGFVCIESTEIRKLFVEPVLQNNGIGSKLLQHAISKGADCLWVLEKNTTAIKFYKRHRFTLTGEKKFEKDTTEFLVKMELDK